MRRILIGLAVLALLWSALWFVGARALERGVETWFAESAADGLQTGYDHIDVAGFPARLRLTVEAPRLRDPVTWIGWQGAELRAGLAAWAPHRPGWALSGPQELLFGPAVVLLEADTLEGGARLRLPDGLPARVDLRTRALAMQAPEVWPNEMPGGWAMALEAGEAEARLDDRALDMALEVAGIGFDGLDWPEAIAARPEGPVERLRIGLQTRFDAPPEAGGQIERLAVEALDLDWGAVRLRGDGVLEVTDAGWPEGRITLRAEDWEPLVALAVALHFLDPEIGETTLRVLETLEEASPEAGVLELPLIFQGGRMTLGPLPLGSAPLLADPDPAG